MGINERLTSTYCNCGATGKQRECNAVDRACNAVSIFFFQNLVIIYEITRLIKHWYLNRK